MVLLRCAISRLLHQRSGATSCSQLTAKLWMRQPRCIAFDVQIKTLSQLPLHTRNRLCLPKDRSYVPILSLTQCTILCNKPSLWTVQKTRHYAQGRNEKDNTSTNGVIYIVSVLILMIGLSYAAVPLYKMFCQATGLGGDPTLGHKIDKVETMEPIRERRINVIFNADHHAAMQWNFKPSQEMITVVPGETALAFYTAKNPTNEPIVGIATYNVIPTQAGLYFNKIQCFCFEEQWLNPHEEVDMPVFFFIDPDFDDDPALADIDDVVLSYTFFKAEKGMKLPLPGFMKLKSVQNVNEVPS